MECKGELKQILGVNGKTVNVLLSLETANLNGINELTDKTLSVSLKPFHPKRSLSANNYCFAIIGKMAEKLKTSTDELYENLITRYGHPYQDEDGNYVTVTMKNNIDVKQLGGHWVWLKDRNGFSSYMMVKGSSEYDSAEMAHFIDMVVEEAKEMGIDTLPTTELERMKEEWTLYCNRKKSVTSAKEEQDFTHIT